MNNYQRFINVAKHWFAVSIASLLCGFWGFVISWLGYGYLIHFAFQRFMNAKFVNDRFWVHCSAMVIGVGFATFPFASLHRHISRARGNRAALAGLLTIILLGVGVFGPFLLWDRFYNDDEPDATLRRYAGPFLVVIALFGVGRSTAILLANNDTSRAQSVQKLTKD